MARFGELEAEIMDRVWAAENGVLVREVVDDLNREREIAYTTVQTVMEILRRKGWLSREREGRAHRYLAAATRDDYLAQLMNEALDQVPDRAAALLRFVERMDPAEIEELRQALGAARHPGDGVGEARVASGEVSSR
jgi:predicted transcriptional regulator